MLTPQVGRRYSVHFYPTIQPANLSVVEEVFLFAGLKSVFTTVFILGGENTKTACVWCDCMAMRESSAPLTYGLIKVRHGSCV